MAHANTILARWQRIGALIACAGAGACLAILWRDPHRLWHAYLFAFLVCWLLCMGGTGLLALGNLTGGRWAAAGRPFYLAAAQTLPLVAILFVPVAVFANRIYPWADASVAELLPDAKAIYLETTFFSIRAVVYFATWLVFCWLLSIVSRLDLPPASTPAMRRVGAITLVLLVPTATFAAFDWAMSLEPEWYSSIYGAILAAAGVLAGHALAICGLVAIGEKAMDALLRAAGSANEAAEIDQLHGGGQQSLRIERHERSSDYLADVCNDLGSLLLAFLMVSAYFALSQFIIIWSGNLPSEITYYLLRSTGGWQWLALTLVLFYFTLPFLLLLSRERKRSSRALRRMALLMLLMYVLYLYWIVVPAFGPASTGLHVLNFAALAVLLGLWLMTFSWLACRCLARIEESR
jgi:hypothetical protein